MLHRAVGSSLSGEAKACEVVAATVQCLADVLA